MHNAIKPDISEIKKLYQGGTEEVVIIQPQEHERTSITEKSTTCLVTKLFTGAVKFVQYWKGKSTKAFVLHFHVISVTDCLSAISAKV